MDPRRGGCIVTHDETSTAGTGSGTACTPGFRISCATPASARFGRRRASGQGSPRSGAAESQDRKGTRLSGRGRTVRHLPDWTHSPLPCAGPKRVADCVVPVDRAWLFHPQQLDRFGLTLPNRVLMLVSVLTEEQSMDLPQEGRPLVPCYPRVQIRIGRGPTDVGLKDGCARGGEVPQDFRPFDRSSEQLGEQVAQVTSRIAQSTFVEVQDDDATLSPEEISRAEVTMDEGRRRGKGRRIAFQGLKGAFQGSSLTGEPFAKMSDSRSDVFKDGVRENRPSWGDRKGVQGRDRATDCGQNHRRVLRHRRRHRLAGLVRQQQETPWCVVSEDARNRETGFSFAVQLSELAKDGGDSAGVFIPIVEFPDPTLSVHTRTSSQPGLSLIADHAPFPE